MMRKFYPIAGLAGLALAALLAGTARAGDKISAPLQLKIYPHLTVAVTPTRAVIHCDAAPGTVVAAISHAGGNGQPVSYTLSAGDTADFAIAGGKVVVGPNGLAAGQCGRAPSVTVTASQ